MVSVPREGSKQITKIDRQHKGTLTIQNQPMTALAIAQIFAGIANQEYLKEDLDYRSGMLLQTIGHAQLSSPAEGSSNMLGLQDEEEPLLRTK